MNRCLALFALCLSLFAVAQTQTRPPQERLEQLKKLRLMEFLRLDEETSVRFFSRYGEHQDAVRDIVEKRSKGIDELYENMKDGDDVDYGRFIDQTIAMEKEIIQERESFLRGLEDILTKRQIAQYVVFERRFNQEVRGMLRDMQERRRRF